MVMMHVNVSSGRVDFGLFNPEGIEANFSHDETECQKSLGLEGESRIDPSQVLFFFILRDKGEVRGANEGIEPSPARVMINLPGSSDEAMSPSEYSGETLRGKSYY